MEGIMRIIITCFSIDKMFVGPLAVDHMDSLCW